MSKREPMAESPPSTQPKPSEPPPAEGVLNESAPPQGIAPEGMPPEGLVPEGFLPESPLSAKLRAGSEDGPGPELPQKEREQLAQKHLTLTLDGYRLVRLLGVGPVSAAYEAVRGTKDAAERAVVRIMVGTAAKHERARSLFLRSAYAANRFNHPRVLPVLGDGLLEDGSAYVVRAWADAEPLDAVIRERGPLPERDGLRMAEQLLDALEMAHSHGIVHGAVTPSNVLITPRASMRLADFATPPGLPGSRMASELDILASRRVSPFAAPERCASPPLAPSEASDIYGAGAVLFYALTGELPRGDARAATELAQTSARPLREVLPSASEGLAQLVDFALRFDPIHRYESAYAMLGDVRRVLAGRKPKLREAVGPSPSSAFDMPGRAGPSSGSILSVAKRNSTPVRRAGGADRVRSTKDEWRGNVALILAIALLVGVATFVVVRERVEEERREAPRPAASP